MNKRGINDYESRSIGVQNLLNKLPHWLILKGNFLISVILIIFFAVIGYSAKYPEFIDSKVILIPSSNYTNNKTIIGLLADSKKDFARIKTGQKVIIKLYDFPYQEFGILEGKVQNVSLINNGKNDFYINVYFPKGLKTSFDKEIPYDKELKGNAEIVIQDLNLIEAIFFRAK